MRRFDFHTPRSLEDAIARLEEFEADGVRIFAGGTDLLVMMKHESLSPRHVVSIKRIPGLREIGRNGESFAIGAAATLSEVTEHPIIQTAYSALVQAIRTIASPQIRNQGTIGGNVCLETKCLFLYRHVEARRSRPECLKEGGEICHIVEGAKRCFSIFAADSVPVLLVLGAKVRIFGSSGSRVVPIQKIYSGDGAKPLTLDKEIVTHVLLPPSNPYCVYLKERWRGSLDFPIVGLAMAAILDSNGRRCEKLSLALTGVTGFPVQIEEDGPLDIRALGEAGQIVQLTERVYKASRSISPMGGLRAYRKAQVRVLIERATSYLFDQIMGREG